MTTIQAVRGMNDILPDETPLWRYLEETLREVLEAYSYREIRLPIVEKTELFKRTIGEVTDIVEKEMYTFDDRNGDSLTLRPEGTACSVRAGIENGLLYNQIQRLWYQGPMFRHERPQKGRYRQFHQVGVEAFGMPGPDIDAEMILLTARLWKRLGLTGLQLQLNSLGSLAARANYREVLVNYLLAHDSQLDDDSRRRLHGNPLRILDSKNPAMQDMLSKAPSLQDYLDTESQEHFAELNALLTKAGVAATFNPRLVRGLDYYNRTVFEWVSDELGAQGTVCAGGRYDGLVAQLGGKATPAIGCAMGLDRLVAILKAKRGDASARAPDCYMVMVGNESQQLGLLLAEQIRDAHPRLSIEVNCGGGSFKNQLKRADKSGAKWALILGEDETAQGNVAVKYLREDKPQTVLAQQALADFLSLSD